MYGEIRIIQVRKKHTVSNSARVRILDICPGGVRFVSALRFPADSKVILELTMTVECQEFRFEGFVRHSRSKGSFGYEYGFCFREPDEGLRSALLKIFGRKMTRLGRHIILLKPDMDI